MLHRAAPLLQAGAAIALAHLPAARALVPGLGVLTGPLGLVLLLVGAALAFGRARPRPVRAAPAAGLGPVRPRRPRGLGDRPALRAGGGALRGRDRLPADGAERVARGRPRPARQLRPRRPPRVPGRLRPDAGGDPARRRALLPDPQRGPLRPPRPRLRPGGPRRLRGAAGAPRRRPRPPRARSRAPGRGRRGGRSPRVGGGGRARPSSSTRPSCTPRSRPPSRSRSPFGSSSCRPGPGPRPPPRSPSRPCRGCTYG